MNILNAKRLPCDECKKDTDHFISAVLNQRACSECWTVTPAQPEDFFKTKVEAVAVMRGDRERRV